LDEGAATVRRSLEDLAALGVIDSNQLDHTTGPTTTWTPTDRIRDHWQTINADQPQATPERS
jgi:hypothetical protein